MDSEWISSPLAWVKTSHALDALSIDTLRSAVAAGVNASSYVRDLLDPAYRRLSGWWCAEQSQTQQPASSPVLLRNELVHLLAQHEDQLRSIVSLIDQKQAHADRNVITALQVKVERLEHELGRKSGALIPSMSRAQLKEQKRWHEEMVRSYEAALEEEADNIRLCKVCRERSLAIVLSPCQHLVLCIECAPQISLCPVCRAVVTSRDRVFF